MALYSIVDIETTGGNSKYEKITEIAVYVFDGEKIVDEFISLINPAKNIPSHISNLTGITNEMVADSPYFYEVARRIVEMTENTIFVAHNVSFDYSFIRTEFKSLGFTFNRSTLCTVKLSRKLLPGYKSYSLGNLCDSLGIQVNGRHRAGGDALATVQLFKLLLEKQRENGLDGFGQPDLGNLHPLLSMENMKSLPEATGLYYIYNEQNELIYIGKSRNIRERVYSHLGNYRTKRASEMRSSIVTVSCEITGSELVALLKESVEIKNNLPLFNRAQRRASTRFGIYNYTDQNGYLRLEIKKNELKSDYIPVTSFENINEAQDFLKQLAEKHHLCQKLCGLYKCTNGCFHLEIGECQGACVGKEPATSYNNRVNIALQTLHYPAQDMYIIDEGRTPEEKSIIKIAGGRLLGYGYVDITEPATYEKMDECITPIEDNRDTRAIICSFLRRNKVEKVIYPKQYSAV